MEIIRKVFQWFIYSSADPRRYALTVRAAGEVAAVYVLQTATTLCGLGFVCLGVEQEWLNQAVYWVEQITLGVLMVVAGIRFFFGFFRKLYYTAFPSV